MEKDTISGPERTLSLYPDDLEVITDQAGCISKPITFKGERLIKESIERLGENRSFSMTLGTIYSGMYEYELAKHFYLDSIRLAPVMKGSTLPLSVLQPQSAGEGVLPSTIPPEYTDISIDLGGKATGRLAKGELYESRMDYQRADEEYQKAYSIDSTPLAKINLADLYARWGKLESAKAYLDEVMSIKNNSWMYYFGTDMKRHLMDISRIYEKIYSGMANREKVMPKKGLKQRLRSMFAAISCRILSWYHGQRYRMYCFEVGKFYQAEGNILDAEWAFFKANRKYPDVARSYLQRAKDIETSIAPGSVPFYLLEEGRLELDPQLLFQASESFHPVWEKGIAEAFISLIPLLQKTGQREESRLILNKLYELLRLRF